MERRAPGIAQRIQLQILMNATARAFGVSGRRIWIHSWEKGLQEYAVFTRDISDQHPVDPERLYAVSCALGKRVCRVTGFTDDTDRRRLVFLLYRGIGIDMSGCLPGTIQVNRCFFSNYYAPWQCALMSGMDSGITGGIMGGGKLTFQQRITEGCDCCTAVFERKEIL